jgi:hypothetical protein
MFFHIPDRTFKRLTGCYKRAVILGKQGEINNLHPLAAAWSNCKMMLDAKSDYKTKPKKTRKLKRHKERMINDDTYDINLLDWFASRVEDFSETAILTGDDSLAAILFEWKERICFNPCSIKPIKL